MKIMLLSVIYVFCAVLVLTSHAAELLTFQAVYRVIYVPIIFWALTALYAYLSNRIRSGSVNMAMVLTLGLPLHLGLVLIDTYFNLIIKTPVLGVMYKVYITIVVYAVVFLAIYFGRMASQKQAFFLPILSIPVYAVYCVMVCKNPKSIFAMIGVATIGFLVSSSEKFYMLLQKIFAKATGILIMRRNAIIFVFSIAFVFRLVFGFNIIHQTQEAYPTGSDDGTTYNIHAIAMVKDASYIKTTDFAPTAWDIGYSFFLALLYKLFGRSFYMVAFIQSIIGAFVPVFVFLLSETVVGKRSVSILAGIWSALDQPLIMISSILGQEALYIPLLTLLVFLLTRHLLDKSGRIAIFRDIAIGLVGGVAAVVRSAVLGFMPLYSALLLFISRKSIAKRLIDISIITALTAFMIAPVTYLNYHNSGKLYLLTSPKPILDWEQDVGGGYFQPSNIALTKIGVNPLRDIKGSFVSIGKNPLAFASIVSDLLKRRIVGFFFCYNFGFFDPVLLVNAAKLANHFASSLEFYIALTVAAGFIMLIADSSMRRRAYPILLLISYYALLHVVVCRMGNMRYRAPIHPYLLIFGSLGIVVFFNSIRKGLKKI